MEEPQRIWLRHRRRVDSWATVDDLLATPLEELLAMLVGRVQKFDSKDWKSRITDSERRVPTSILMAIIVLRFGDLVEEARERREGRRTRR